MFAITLGFEALNCGQAERKRMASHQFRFYHRRPVYQMLLRTILFAIAASAMSWSFYSRSTKLGMYSSKMLNLTFHQLFNLKKTSFFKRCFVRASESARLAETVVGFFWILFFYIKPTIFSIRKSLGLMSDCHHQIQILKHERELKIDSQLLLFKDHHRRLFNVIFTIVLIHFQLFHYHLGKFSKFYPTYKQVSQINLFSWICLTIPYVIQVVSLVAGLGGALIRLEEWSDWNATVLVGITRSLPLFNCFFLICAFAVYAISAI